MNEEKCYKKDKFVCRECTKEWDTPGAASSCWNRHQLMEVLERVYNHEALYIEDVIEAIEAMVLAGEFDREDDIERNLRIQEKRSEAMERDVDQLKVYIKKLEAAIAEDWREASAGSCVNAYEACEWREYDG